MTTHFSILAWKIHGEEEPSGLQSKESQRVGHNWAYTHILHAKYYRECQRNQIFFCLCEALY